MRRTFVLRVDHETDLETGRFIGHAEDVETGSEMTFQSTNELFAFLKRYLQTEEQKDSTKEGARRRHRTEKRKD